jgi:hypothetical protein
VTPRESSPSTWRERGCLHPLRAAPWRSGSGPSSTGSGTATGQSSSSSGRSASRRLMPLRPPTGARRMTRDGPSWQRNSGHGWMGRPRRVLEQVIPGKRGTRQTGHFPLKLPRSIKLNRHRTLSHRRSSLISAASERPTGCRSGTDTPPSLPAATGGHRRRPDPAGVGPEGGRPGQHPPRLGGRPGLPRPACPAAAGRRAGGAGRAVRRGGWKTWRRRAGPEGPRRERKGKAP